MRFSFEVVLNGALRYPARELSGRGGTPVRLLVCCLISLMWLPAGFYAAETAVTGDLPWLTDLDEWLYLAGLVPATVMRSVYVASLGGAAADVQKTVRTVREIEALGCYSVIGRRRRHGQRTVAYGMVD